MAKEYSFPAGAADAGRRLDIVLASFAAREKLDVSRSAFKSRGIPVTVNGRPEKLSATVRAGDRISFGIPDSRPAQAVPQDIPFRIIYRDRDIAVIDKPWGLTVHPAHGHADGTLVNGLLFRMKGKLSSIGGVERPGIVHRLDKDTAGLMVIALTDRAHRKLSEDFQSRRVVKTYHAVVKGRTEPEGRIEFPIGRSKRNRKKMAVTHDGKPALTEYRALKFLKDHTYLEIGLKTGRTHQIRVHLSHMGHPVAGDPLYGRKADRYGLPGLALCAKKLEFDHPVTGKRVCFETELPPEFRALVKRLSEPGSRKAGKRGN